jgi:hypothetical protein
MRIFVSSSFQDLQDYRQAAIRVLRQLGHEVVAMEDFVAASAAPLDLVLGKVERCELYVGLFAWRYGFVPKPREDSDQVTPVPQVEGAQYGLTSITHYEYLQAKAKGLDCLVFLLDESAPWPPHLIDGFSTRDPDAPRDAQAIRALRNELQLNAVVSYFSNPNELEARVGAAVTVASMSKQVRLNLAQVGQVYDTVNDSLPEHGIRTAIQNAGQQRVLKVDLAGAWWSTRLYLTSLLAERLTDVRRILIVQGSTFVGLVSTGWIDTVLTWKHPQLAKVGKKLKGRLTLLPDIDKELTASFALWKESFGGEEQARAQEEAAKVDLTPDLLKRWFGDSMLQLPVRVVDLSRATVIDLLRILDYPSEFVPVVTRGSAPTGSKEPEGAALDSIQVVDKSALNAQLAQSYITELMDSGQLV